MRFTHLKILETQSPVLDSPSGEAITADDVRMGTAVKAEMEE